MPGSTRRALVDLGVARLGAQLAEEGGGDAAVEMPLPDVVLDAVELRLLLPLSELRAQAISVRAPGVVESAADVGLRSPHLLVPLPHPDGVVQPAELQEAHAALGGGHQHLLLAEVRPPEVVHEAAGLGVLELRDEPAALGGDVVAVEQRRPHRDAGQRVRVGLLVLSRPAGQGPGFHAVAGQAVLGGPRDVGLGLGDAAGERQGPAHAVVEDRAVVLADGAVGARVVEQPLHPALEGRLVERRAVHQRQ